MTTPLTYAEVKRIAQGGPVRDLADPAAVKDAHAVFAVLENGNIARVSYWTTYEDAVNQWYPLDDHRLMPGQEIRVGGTKVKHFAVRSSGDVQYTLDRPGFTLKSYERPVIYSKPYASDTYAAKKALMPLGYEGRPGGWIYRNGKPVMQGWVSTAAYVGHRVVWTPEGYRYTV